MKSNRRQFFKASATAVAAATTAAKAADPFAPAEPGLPAKIFNKGKQHVLPKWAFDGYKPLPDVPADPPRLLQIPPTPKPTSTDTWQNLSGGSSHNPTTKPFNRASSPDPLGVGKVMHGTAAEWNGNIIGGNKWLDNGTWKDAESAWHAMRERVRPDIKSTSYGIDDVGNWGKFSKDGKPTANSGIDSLVHCYKVVMMEKLAKLRPDAKFAALLYSYGNLLPGPTFRFRHGMPCVVRFENQLQTETSIHHHGGHNPTHGDGFPSYYVLQGQARDYLYPNILPLRDTEAPGDKQVTEIDFGEGQSTTWYHDHGLDATAYNVSHGLSGFALWFDDLELNLIRQGVLPGIGLITKKKKKKLKGKDGKDVEIDDGDELDAQGRRIILNQSISGFDPELEKQALEAAWKAWKAKNPESYWSKRHDLASKNLPDPEERTDVNFDHFYRTPLTPYFNPYDIPIALQDRIIDQQTGQIVYDSNGHNGYIGDTQLINARPWPAHMVKSRKYRLRILDGSNSRIYRLRFLDSDTFGLRPNGSPNGDLEPANIPAATLEARAMDFLRIGKDSWMWPMPQKRKSLILNMANRADLIVDFKAWYEAAAAAGRLVPHPTEPGVLVAEYYLVNTMPQFDGRGPKTKLAEDAGDPNVFPLPFTVSPGNPVVNEMRKANVIPAPFLAAGPLAQASELNQPIGLVKFIITPDMGEGEDASIDETTVLRPRHAIKDEEVRAVREFTFERGKGAWMINSRFYDPTICNANPIVGIKGQRFAAPDGAKQPADYEKPQSLTYSEEWILRNGGGGWWHPIHIHLEGHQLVSYEKDFEADGLVGADGILGAAAQAQMAGLPGWNDLVGKFGFDALTNLSAAQTQLVSEVRDFLQGKGLNALLTDEIAATPQLTILLNRPGSGAAIFPLLAKKLKSKIDELPAAALAVWRGLDQLRLQWAGEIVGNHDTQVLGPNTIARIRMRFRTWTGPLVFHCHNVEHEDMRMMVNFEATMSGECSELNQHNPDIAPAARSHGQAVTDLLTNPNAVGELPWEPEGINQRGFPVFRWEEKPVPGTEVNEARQPLIKPRETPE